MFRLSTVGRKKGLQIAVLEFFPGCCNEIYTVDIQYV